MQKKLNEYKNLACPYKKKKHILFSDISLPRSWNKGNETVAINKNLIAIEALTTGLLQEVLRDFYRK